MPEQYPALVLSSTNIGSILRRDFPRGDLFKFWSLLLMVGETALENWTAQAIGEGEIMASESIATIALTHASTVYPVFKAYYYELVRHRTLVEFLVGDVSRETWNFEDSLTVAQASVLGSFYQEEGGYFVSVFSTFEARSLPFA